jgi:hypothetical protein
MRLPRASFLLVLAAVGFGGWLSPPSAPAPPRAGSPEPPLRTLSWEISDVDGDNRPEVATSRIDGSGGASVEIAFSTPLRNATFPVAGGGLGLGVFVCDVDDDNDQDLVFASPGSPERFVVYLNDGNGHFKKGEQWSGPNFVRAGARSGYHSAETDTEPPSLCLSERLPFDRSPARVAFAQLEPQASISSTPGQGSSRLLESRLSARGPPQLLSI